MTEVNAALSSIFTACHPYTIGHENGTDISFF